MKKWLKRIGLVVLLLVVAAVGAGLYLWQGVKDVPDFYAMAPLTGDKRLQAIESVERKVLNLQSQLDQAYANARANQTRPAEAETPSDASDKPAEVSVTFSGPELDTYFNKWLDDSGYGDRISRYMNQPRVGIQDGYIILAGQMRDFDAVVSLYFLPEIDETGSTALQLDGIYAGRIPVPRSAFESFRARTTQALSEKLPELRESADINDEGIANEDAMLLSSQEQLQQLLNGEEVESLILFPQLIGRGAVPARVAAMNVEGDEVQLELQLLTQSERTKLIEDLQTPPVDSSEEWAAETFE